MGTCSEGLRVPELSHRRSEFGLLLKAHLWALWLQLRARSSAERLHLTSTFQSPDCGSPPPPTCPEPFWPPRKPGHEAGARAQPRAPNITRAATCCSFPGSGHPGLSPPRTGSARAAPRPGGVPPPGRASCSPERPEAAPSPGTALSAGSRNALNACLHSGW